MSGIIDKSYEGDRPVGIIMNMFYMRYVGSTLEQTHVRRRERFKDLTDGPTHPNRSFTNYPS